ncbi:hypothetical protein ACFQ0O_18410 [Saccharopolyspora spinosporotrichia]
MAVADGLGDGLRVGDVELEVGLGQGAAQPLIQAGARYSATVMLAETRRRGSCWARRARTPFISPSTWASTWRAQSATMTPAG